jgi:hypothetical protein
MLALVGLALATTTLVPSFATAQHTSRASVHATRASLAGALGDPSERARGNDWTFDLSASTSFPLSVGLDAHVTSPIGLMFHGSVGHTPNAYLGAIASLLGDANAYPDNVDALVREGIGNGAWNLRLGVGIVVWPGLELEGGYTLLAAQASLTPGSIEAAIGQNVSWPGMSVVPLSLVVHALHARLGWRFVVAEHLVIRIALGWTHAVGSSAHVEVPTELRPAADAIQTSIAQGVGRWGFTPEVLLSAGYRF